jgi:TonB family protein
MRPALALMILTMLAAGAASAPAGGAQSDSGTQAETAEAARLNDEVLRLYREEKYDEALPVAKRVLELREKALGADDQMVAYALSNLANIYSRKGKFGEAEPLLQRALAVKERLHGAEGAAVVPELLNLTNLHFLRGEFEQAHALLGRALSILESQPPREDPATAKRLKSYYCPLLGRGPAYNKELSKRVGDVIWRLEEPEQAAKYEKERKEREARGEDYTKIVEGSVLNGRAISKPQPDYPSAAKQQGAQGVVVVHITVDESGKVIKAEPFCGHPLLAGAAVEAARAARFTPTLLSGMPVKVSGIITYNFVLQ